MSFFHLALEMEEELIETYQDLANQCVSHAGIHNILQMLIRDQKKHVALIRGMREQTEATVDQTAAFRKARQLFESMQEQKQAFSCDLDQLKVYRQALSMLTRKKDFYQESLEHLENENNREALKKIISEEARQAIVLDNIIQMVDRPNLWLETAEFNHLDEY